MLDSSVARVESITTIIKIINNTLNAPIYFNNLLTTFLTFFGFSFGIIKRPPGPLPGPPIGLRLF